jgi:hypothetical protein
MEQPLSRLAMADAVFDFFLNLGLKLGRERLHRCVVGEFGHLPAIQSPQLIVEVFAQLFEPDAAFAIELC